MPIWRPRPASELPRIPLSRWRVFETEDGSRHFVGVDMFDRSGRVSSSIVTFDPVTMQGTTQTGRIYELVGRKGSSLNVDYVWMRWCELYEVTSFTDVTERLLDGADDDDPTRAHESRNRYQRAAADARIRQRDNHRRTCPDGSARPAQALPARH
jgi:hypothetical protein